MSLVTQKTLPHMRQWRRDHTSSLYYEAPGPEYNEDHCLSLCRLSCRRHVRYGAAYEASHCAAAIDQGGLPCAPERGLAARAGERVAVRHPAGRLQREQVPVPFQHCAQRHVRRRRGWHQRHSVAARFVPLRHVFPLPWHLNERAASV
jgi:hypothetical protein